MKITAYVRYSEETKNKNTTFENLFIVRYLVIQLLLKETTKCAHIYLSLSFVGIFNEKNTHNC